jgi:hypothetical protein
MSAAEGKKKIGDAIAGATPASPAPSKPPTGPAEWEHGPFKLNKGGVWFKKGDANFWVCGPIDPTLEMRDVDSKNWSIRLRFWDRDGCLHEEDIPRHLIDGDRGELRRLLAQAGLSLNPHPVARQALAEYLSLRASEHRAISVARGGWHQVGGKRVFVLPDETIGKTHEPVVLQTETKMPSLFGQAGTLAEWQAEIAARCKGNSRLILAVCCGFGAALLDPLGEEGGGVHLFGGTSKGKSTLLRVAASVCGGDPARGAAANVKSWRSTGNALENTGAAHSDTLLCLDEISEADGKEIGATCYMLGNGTGKSRADRAGGARQPPVFRVLFLSSGEQTLASIIAEAGKRLLGGMETRMLDLPAVPKGGAGVFERFEIDGDPAALSVALMEGVQRLYGTPLRAFLKHLVARLNADPDCIAEIKASIQQRVKRWMEPVQDATGAVQRVAKRLALIAEAGVMAAEAGILAGGVPGSAWRAEDIDQAVLTCLRDWLDARGFAGAREDAEAVEKLRGFVSRFSGSRFTEWRPPSDLAEISDPQPPVERMRALDSVGWRKWMPDNGGFWRHYLSVDGIKVVLEGLDQKAAVATLVQRGLIVPPPQKPGERAYYSVLLTPPGFKKQRLYQVAEGIGSAGTGGTHGDGADGPDFGGD